MPSTEGEQDIQTKLQIPKWEVSLRKDALIRASHASTAIEGNPLTIEEVSMLAHGRKVLAARKAEQLSFRLSFPDPFFIRAGLMK